VLTISLTTQRQKVSDAGSEGRIATAGELIRRLAASTAKDRASTAVRDMRKVALAAQEWCDFRLSSTMMGAKTQQSVPPDCPLNTLQRLNVPPPTRVPPVDLTGKYDDVRTLQRYGSKFTVLGGLHHPKKNLVYDSVGDTSYEIVSLIFGCRLWVDGLRCVQFKGQDEVRQDAVMEQVFQLSNRLLSRDRQSKARSLLFRTYVVIPLPGSTGIMEFVGESMAIGQWLSSAHNL
jgi:ataxia telangiectasia mutated family protein